MSEDKVGFVKSGLIFFSVIIASLAGCKEKKNLTAVKNGFPFDYIRQLNAQMGNALSTGPNQRIIRIWKIEVVVTPNSLFTFIQDNNSFYSQRCRYEDSTFYTFKKVNDTLENRTSHYLLQKVSCEPPYQKIPVKRLIDTTFSLGIDTLKSQPDEIKLKFGDGTSYVVEIINGESYNIIEYSNPELIKDKSHQLFSKYLKVMLNE